jgi:UDP-4-amino-4-deoxy-L-arabinose formyltransferase/UDP-glucuronic acid dehydrogenase (UDP-4-keto-hexauronic acid decarboxylating)
VRVVLFGYHDMGAIALDALLAQGDEVALVVTHKDDPHEGRWFRTPAEVALPRGVEVVYRDDLSPQAPQEIAARVAAARPDLVLSAYYRKLIPMSVVKAARLGGLNLHGSLLPRLRGCAPVNWAIVLGEPRTGVTLHHMVVEPDAGDVVAQRAVDVGPRETALTLHRKLCAAAADLLADALPRVRAGAAPRTPQDEAQATYRGRRRPADGRLDPQGTVLDADRLVRAVARPWPGAFLERGSHGSASPPRLLVWEAHPHEGAPPAGARPGDLVRLPSGEAALTLQDGLLVLDLVQEEGQAPVAGRALALTVEEATA